MGFPTLHAQRSPRESQHYIVNAMAGVRTVREAVWLALEVKKVDYDTVFIDNIKILFVPLFNNYFFSSNSPGRGSSSM